MLLRDTTVTFAALPNGAPGIRETLRHMRRLARAGRVSLVIRETAFALVEEIPAKHWRGEIEAIYSFVRDEIRYTGDVEGIETLQGPEYTLAHRHGDCDDKSVLLASLLGAIEHPVRFVAVSYEPGLYSHVYVETRLGNNWIPLETTEPVEIGFDPGQGAFQKMIEHI